VFDRRVAATARRPWLAITHANTSREGEQGRSGSGRTRRGEARSPKAACRKFLAQRSGEALDTRAGVLKDRLRGRVGDAEVRAKAEGRAVNNCNALSLEQLEREILVGLDDLARRRGLAEQAGNRRVDVERAFRRRAGN